MAVRQRSPRLAAWMGAASTLLLAAFLCGERAARPEDPPAETASSLPTVTVLPVEVEQSGEPTERLREGTQLVDLCGRFSQTGDRVAFYQGDEEKRMVCLENLALERVAAVVRESPDAVEWTVSGAITEFQGVNYLLLERAAQHSRDTASAAE